MSSDGRGGGWDGPRMDAHLFGLVHDVAGPDPIALQVCVEAGVEPRGSQAVSGDDAFIHDLAAAPESRERNRPRASLGTGERAVQWVGACTATATFPQRHLTGRSKEFVKNPDVYVKLPAFELQQPALFELQKLVLFSF